MFLFKDNVQSGAQVVPLKYNNMTLFEVIASAGGIGGGNSSKKITIIRRTNKGDKIFNIDPTRLAKTIISTIYPITFFYSILPALYSTCPKNI